MITSFGGPHASPQVRGSFTKHMLELEQIWLLLNLGSKKKSSSETSASNLKIICTCHAGLLYLYNCNL